MLVIGNSEDFPESLVSNRPAKVCLRRFQHLLIYPNQREVSLAIRAWVVKTNYKEMTTGKDVELKNHHQIGV